MKIIDIQLGRKASYGGADARAGQPWQATVFSRNSAGAVYPDEMTVPPEIAELMAIAAYQVLADSDLLKPGFEHVTVTPIPTRPEPMLQEEIEPVPVVDPDFYVKGPAF